MHWGLKEHTLSENDISFIFSFRLLSIYIANYVKLHFIMNVGAGWLIIVFAGATSITFKNCFMVLMIFRNKLEREMD